MKPYKKPPVFSQKKLRGRKKQLKSRETKLRKRYSAKTASIPRFRLSPGFAEIKKRALNSKGFFVVVVCGPSSTGKTSFVSRIAKELNAGVLGTDHYYRERAMVAKLPLYFDDVRSVNLKALKSDIQKWQDGKDLVMPLHDSATHKSLGKKKITNTRILFVEGITAFHPTIARLADLRVYFDSSQQKRLKRRYKRDVKERGRTPDHARNRFYSTVEESRLQYIEQQRHKEDMIIQN